MDIAIVDYGVGNLRSAQKAIEHGGHTSVITGDAAVLRSAPRIILPGVGAFGAAIQNLRASGLDKVVTDEARGGKPVLGICLGMQLLLSKAYELGEWDGLDLVPGDVVKFDAPGLKIPQIGWNTVDPTGTSPLLNGVEPGMMFYFVHSYYCRPANGANVGGFTDFGGPYCSVIAAGNVHGAQFHPEKSGKAGLRFLKNFAELPV
jgi:glutamine amidotransferase